MGEGEGQVLGTVLEVTEVAELPLEVAVAVADLEEQGAMVRLALPLAAGVVEGYTQAELRQTSVLLLPVVVVVAAAILGVVMELGVQHPRPA